MVIERGYTDPPKEKPGTLGPPTDAFARSMGKTGFLKKEGLQAEPNLFLVTNLV